ncbi:MAG TPA: hypothetical protein DDZ11_11220 [Lentisphaeria bacterium]|nr:hypothetical protein [Lentisphaeria bacterium]
MIPFLLIIKTFQFYYLLPVQDKILHGKYNKIQLFQKHPQACMFSQAETLQKTGTYCFFKPSTAYILCAV